MGWNSWDCFGGSVTEEEVLANARFMAEHLRDRGWDTIVIDIQWSDPDPGRHAYRPLPQPVLDDWGRLLPAATRFPSAADGSFRPLASQLHELGLRLGLHVMRGIPRGALERNLPVYGTDITAEAIADRDNVCSWNPDNVGLNHDHPGAQAYLDSQAALFAEWGVDYVKLDDVLYPPVQTADIAAWSRAIDRSGRPMVLSLSPGKELSTAHVEDLRAHAQLWRISDDLWDEWPQLREQFQRAARWAPLQQAGAWADADMLPLGRIGIRAHVGDDRMSRLRIAEQQTMLALWALLRSPMMFGGHLPDTPAETLALLRNEGVGALLRHGTGGREVVRDGSLVIWTARLDGDDVCGVFWLGDEPADLLVHLADLGCSGRTDAADLWSGAAVLVEQDALRLRVPAHGVRLLQLSGPGR